MDIFGAVSAPTAKSAFLFLTSFCRTLDPDTRSVKVLPAWPVIERLVGELFDRGNQHWRKSRQMLVSWIACAYSLWEYQFVPGSFILFTSRAEKLVDDGGERSSVRSLLGRVRFIYQNLPRYVKRDANISFLKIAHPSGSGNAIVGENANPNMGRSGNFSRAFLDEWAFVPNSETCWAAIDRACPDDKVLISTFNYPEGNFYRLWEEKPHTIRYISIGWWERPERAVGLYIGEHGEKRSPWYDAACASLTSDEVARELDMNPLRSASGIVLPEFSFERHMRSDVVYDENLPLRGGLDFGIGAPTAGYLFQLSPSKPRMRCLVDYEQANASGAVNAANLWGLCKQVGFQGTRAEVLFTGDPAGNSREIATGSNVIREYKEYGFSSFTTKKVRLKDGIRLLRRLLLTDDLVFSVEGCTMTPKRIAGYRYPVDDSGNVKGDEPVKDIQGHLMDGLRYAATANFPIDGVSDVITYKLPETRDEGRTPYDVPVLAHEDRIRPLMTFPEHF